MKLRTRLFLLFLLSGVVPLLIVSLAGLAPLRHQRGLWSLPTVESALEASLASNRKLVDRALRTLEDLGQTGASALSWVPGSVAGTRANLEWLAADPAVDFAGFLVPTTGRWEFLSATATADSVALAGLVPNPSASAEGPQRSRPIRWSDPAGDLLLVPTYIWPRELASADTTGGTRPLEPIGCLLLGSRIGVGTFEDLEETSSAIFNYRRFGELGSLLALAQILFLALAFLASLVVSAVLARSVAKRISSPVEDLVDALATIGSPRVAPRFLPTGIPELARIRDAFTGMRARLTEYEEQAREYERVQASQETARFVAHEIRNALTPVTAGIAVLERRVDTLPEESRPQGRRALEAIRREAERMAALAASFSEYAHLPAPKPSWIDPGEAVRAASTEAPPEIEVVTRIPEEAPLLFIDRDEFERLLRNVVKNACEAMEGRGRLEASLHVDDRAITVEIRDNGPGMDEQTLRQALHPGFTTKEGGSGLGLALVRGSVIRYGGKLDVESEPGRGTTVRIRLPLEPETGAPPRPEVAGNPGMSDANGIATGSRGGRKR